MTIKTGARVHALTEKYRPKTESELIGNEKAINKFKDALSEGKHCLLYGLPGIGKTSAVYAIASDLGYSVVEVNASDERRKGELESLLGRVKMKGFRKWLLLMDEVDGIRNWGLVQKILTEAAHPVVLVANDEYKIPKKLKDLSVKVRFYRPKLSEVVKRVKHIAKAERLDVKYGEISGDVRSSINAVMYGGAKYEIENHFDMVSLALSRGIVGDLSDDDLVWLLDNLHQFYRGRDLYEASQLLALAARTRLDVLRLLPRGRGKPLYPYFLRRKRVLGGKR